MLKNRSRATLVASFAWLLGAVSVHAQEPNALSTSNFVEVPYTRDGGKTIIRTCGGEKAVFARSYVSISIEKLTVNKHDNLITRIVDRNRRVFPTAYLKSTYNTQSISIAKVGKPVALSGADSSVDAGVQWGMLDRIPWVLKGASFELKLGYSANSASDALAEAFNGITSSIPGYSISTSLATGLAVTNAIDKLLFAPDRTIDLLRASRDLPLLAGQLCDGYYVLLSAENKNTYSKYLDESLIWTGIDLLHKGRAINDVSYAVISVKVTDRYYESTKDAFNDSSRQWTTKYSDALSSLNDLILVSTPNEVTEKEKSILSKLQEGRILLNADSDLIFDEKSDIHKYALEQFSEQIKIVKARITPDKKVTAASTKAALETAAIATASLGGQMFFKAAQKILENPKANLPEISDNAALGAKLSSSVRSIENVIRLQ